MDKNVALIMRGELGNKGAQAMVFATVSEIASRFPELIPVVVSAADCAPIGIERIKHRSSREDLDNFKFKIVWGGTPDASEYLLGCMPKGNVVRRAKQLCLRFNRIKDYKQLSILFDRTAICFDISGFAFGDKWGFENCLDYLRRLEVYAKGDFPTYLMPQSFGPFQFSSAEEREIILEKAREKMPLMRCIFAREKQGYEDLNALNQELNIYMSDDIVLQSNDLVLSSIFKQVPKPKHFKRRGRTVGIVPNARNEDHCDVKWLNQFYCMLIDSLLTNGYENILLIRHASEDISICTRIKSQYAQDGRVRLLDDDLYCFEYGEIFAACDFVIASRFHSIVHAYREGIPCIALGWAVKYRELLERCGQNGLAFDVTSPDFNPNDVLAAVDRVIAEHDELSSRIKAAVAEARRHNVFDVVEQDFRSLQGGRAR